MSRKHVLACGVVVCLFLFFYFRDARSKVANTSNPPTRAGFENALPTKQPEKATDSDFSVESISTTKLESLIASADDKVTATLGAYLLTFDEKFLNELKNYPDSSAACSFLAMHVTPIAERLAWSKKLQLLEPGNSWGWIMECQAQLRQKNVDDAISAMSLALTKKSFVTPDKELSVCLRSVLSGLGATPDLARQVAIEKKPSKQFALEMMATCNLLWQSQNDKVQDEESKIQAAEMQLRIVDLMNRSLTGSIDVTLTARSVEGNVLSKLPSDLEYGRDGYTVADRIQELKKEGAILTNDLKRTNDILNDSPAAIQNEYMERVDLLGETAARKWLLGLNR